MYMYTDEIKHSREQKLHAYHIWVFIDLKHTRIFSAVTYIRLIRMNQLCFYTSFNYLESVNMVGLL